MKSEARIWIVLAISLARYYQADSLLDLTS